MFTWEDFLSFADRLQGSTDEAELRTAISRAYYAVHHSSKVFCTLRNMVHLTATGEDHREVIVALEKHKNPILSKTGRKLKSLFGWRIKADYSENLSVNLIAQCQYCVKEAHAIMSDLKSVR